MPQSQLVSRSVPLRCLGVRARSLTSRLLCVSSESVYFKDKRMHDLDRHFGDLHSVLVDKEIEIAHKLSEVVLEQTEVIQDAARMCDELDW